jgi:GAF domain-containing protein
MNRTAKPKPRGVEAGTHPAGTSSKTRRVVGPAADARHRGAKKAQAKTSGAKRAPEKRSLELSLARARAAEALEQQSATAEILQVISRSPAELQPVLDTIVRNAARLCGGLFANVLRFDGELLHFVATSNLKPKFLDLLRKRYPARPEDSLIAGRVIRKKSVVVMKDALADSHYSPSFAIAGGWRRMLAVPMIREGKPLGVIQVGWAKPGPVSKTHEELLKTFADQAVIAIENVRLFTELEARNGELRVALEHQTATSELLKVIGRSAFDLQPVFETLAENAARLCAAERALIFRFDGKLLRFGVGHNVSPELREFFDLHPIAPGRGTNAGRAALERRTIHNLDVLSDPEYDYGGSKVDPYRTVLAVPMLKADELLGVIIIYRHEVRAFTDNQIALMETFADQAVIAIENVRLFTELEARNSDLTEALEQQTATSDILRVISRSPTDVQPVFDAIANAARELCRATSANVFTYDGELVRVAAMVNLNPAYVESMHVVYPRRPGRETAVARAIMTRSIVMIPDVLEDPDYVTTLGAHATAGGFRSVLAVPLMREGQAIGGIAVGRAAPGRFPETQVALLKTFADQAVIAIENVRLFNELETRNRDLTEALEQQTATSDILRVISQSQTNVQPVFDTIAGAAQKLCNASAGLVFTFDGELIHLVAIANLDPAGADAWRNAFPRPPSRDTASTRAVLTRSIVAIPDVLEDPDYVIGPAAASSGFRSALAVPLMREGNPIGVIGVGRTEPGPFPDKQIALLKTFADQALIAIENARLFKELEARTADLTRSVGELKALGEVGQAVSSTLDLETVLRTIVSRATQLAGMDGGLIWEYDETREEFHLHATDKLPDELIEALRATPIKKGEGAVGRLAVTGEPVQIRDIADGGIYQSRVRDILVRLGYRSLLAVPLLREDHLLGGLVVNRKSADEFAPEIIELLKTFATQSALAIQNARLFREIGDKSRQLEIASQHKSEFLANMSHELRTPLNAIIGFSEVLHERMFGEINDKQAEYLADILESGRHLLSLINDILDLSKIEAGRMELEPSEFDLPNAIENTLILVRERAQRRAITLGHNVDERLGTIRADERKVKQVLLNLLSNALKFTPEGGRVEVAAGVHDGVTEISVTDTGVGIAPEDQEAVFEEFRQVGTASKKVEGTGLGLAISRKFIELHGGKIWVTSQPGKGSTFTFTLPLTSDQRIEAPSAS